MWKPIRKTNSSPSVMKRRFRISSTLNRFRTGPSISGDLLGLAARRLDRRLRGLAERVRANDELPVDLPAAENLHRLRVARDDALRLQLVGTDGRAGVEHGEVVDVDRVVDHLEEVVRESALGQ